MVTHIVDSLFVDASVSCWTGWSHWLVLDIGWGNVTTFSTKLVVVTVATVHTLYRVNVVTMVTMVTMVTVVIVIVSLIRLLWVWPTYRAWGREVVGLLNYLILWVSMATSMVTMVTRSSIGVHLSLGREGKAWSISRIHDMWWGCVGVIRSFTLCILGIYCRGRGTALPFWVGKHWVTAGESGLLLSSMENGKLSWWKV